MRAPQWGFLATLSVLVHFQAPAEAQVQPWPGEPWQQATTLTHLASNFQGNLSGAHWNPVTREMWVVCNGPARFWALVEDGAGSWKIADKGGSQARYDATGDTEGITQADLNEEVVYVVDEDGYIHAYEVSTGGAPAHQTRWNISSYIPYHIGGLGPEGLAFVPDSWLAARGFVDGNSNPRTSQNGMGGLMFVVHQNGGNLYVFDLDRSNGSLDFVGQYQTAYSESSGLEFDRDSGKLHIWHNTAGNVIEINDLTSLSNGSGLRQMTTLELIQSPKGGNIEGIAFTHESSGEGYWWFTDDANQNGGGLMWFQHYPVSLLHGAAGPNPPGDSAVTMTEQDVAMLQLQLRASQDVTVSRLTVHAQGTGDDAIGISAVQLWHDVDGSGTVTAADVPLGPAGVFNQDDGLVDFFLSDSIPAGASRDYLVTASLNAAGGVTFQFAFDPRVDLLATSGAFTIFPTGASQLGGNMRTIPGSATTPPPTGTTAPGATPGSGAASTAPSRRSSSSSGGCSLGSGSAPGGAGLALLLLCLLTARAVYRP